MILNVYLPNSRASKCKKQKLIIEPKGEADESINILIVDFSTSSVTNRTTRQKIRQDIEELDDTVNQQYLISIEKHFIQQQWINVFFRQHSPRLNISWAIKQTLAHLSELKSCRICYPTTVQSSRSQLHKYNRKISKHLEIKWDTYKHSMGQRAGLKGYLKI